MRSWLGLPVALSFLVLASGLGPAAAQVSGSPRAPDPVGAEKTDIVIAVAGDMIGPYRPLAELESPGFDGVLRLFKDADAGFANHEGSAFDLDAFPGWPAAENGGGTPLSPAITARELNDAGLTMMSKANNHATDWDIAGLAATEEVLRAAGISIAGSGPSEAAARAPTIRDTPAGRIALVSTASSFTPMSRAADAVASKEKPQRARPGISVLRTIPVTLVDSVEFAAMSAIARRRGLPVFAESVQIGEQGFGLSDRPGGTYQVDARDRKAVLDAVAVAAREADLSIFTIHAHETASTAGPRSADGPAPSEDPVPADFLPQLFHEAIDAGASMVVRHGPHSLNGIEIYKGRPIFYSMGSLFFDFGGKRRYTIPGTRQVIEFPDEWFESAVAKIRYRRGELVDVRIYPVMIEVSEAPTNGLPLTASGADAQRILERLQRDSAAYGTRIRIVDNVGIIDGAAR